MEAQSIQDIQEICHYGITVINNYSPIIKQKRQTKLSHLSICSFQHLSCVTTKHIQNLLIKG